MHITTVIVERAGGPVGAWPSGVQTVLFCFSDQMVNARYFRFVIESRIAFRGPAGNRGD